MPLYEYRCKSCGQSFEKMLRWSEADRGQVCPNCQSLDTQKKISMVASTSSSGSFSSGSSSSCGSGGGGGFS
jgi:putative FmdB family regulatory protein